MDYSRRRAAHDDSDIDWRWWLVPLTLFLAGLGVVFGFSIPAVDHSLSPVHPVLSAQASADPASASMADPAADPARPGANARDAADEVETEDNHAATF